MIEIIDILKPKNNGTFPVVEAVDVKVTNDKRLDAALNDKANQSDLTALQTTVAGKASQADFTMLSNTVAGKASQSDLTALSAVVATKASVSELATKADQVDLDSLEVTMDDKADQTDVDAQNARIDAIAASVGAGTADTEIAQARVSDDGTEYNSLNARISGDNAILSNKLKDAEQDIDSMSGVYQLKKRKIKTGANYIELTCKVGSTYRITNDTTNNILIKTMLNGQEVQTVREALPAGGTYDYECADMADTVYIYANSNGYCIIEDVSTWYYETTNNISNLSVFLNAKDYGVSSESADNHDAIIAAIAAAMTTGKPLYFEAGTYVTSNIELTYPSQLKVVGTGYNKGKATIFRPKAGANILTFYGGNCCTFENLYFQGTVVLADNSPNTSDCRFNDLYFNNCTWYYNGYGVKIDSPCGYVKFDKCSFKCPRGITIGMDFQNTVSVIPNYIYIMNCEFFGYDNNTNSCGVLIQRGRVIKIQNCDFAGFQTNYPSIRVYASGTVDYIDIVENMFMNNVYPISVNTTESSGYIQRIRINSNGFDLANNGKGVYIDGGYTRGGMFELQLVGNITSGATTNQLSGYVFSVNNVNTVTFAHNEAHALLDAKDCASFTNIYRMQDKSYKSDGASFALSAGETKNVKFGHKRMWYSADKDIWHTGNDISYTRSYDSATNELTVAFTNNSAQTQYIHADLL